MVFLVKKSNSQFVTFGLHTILEGHSKFWYSKVDVHVFSLMVDFSSRSFQPSLMEIRDTVTSFNLFICDLGHVILIFFMPKKHKFHGNVCSRHRGIDADFHSHSLQINKKKRWLDKINIMT